MLALSLEIEVLALTEEASKVPTDTSENFQTVMRRTCSRWPADCRRMRGAEQI